MNDQSFTGESGAGLVKVTINTAGRASRVEIDDLIFKETDKQLISDLFIAALNNAYDKADTWIKQEAMNIYQKQLVELNKTNPQSNDFPLDLDITKLFKPGSDDGDSGNV